MSLKVFDLCCGNGHAFEGWFSSDTDYHAQLHGGLLVCPLCADHGVVRMPSAPRLNLGSVEASEKSEPTQQKGMQASLMPSAQQLQQALMKMAREISATAEDVGERFAEEARRIHYQEAPERGIRGVTSTQEAQALVDEGIPVVPMPFGELLKEPLQ